MKRKLLLFLSISIQITVQSQIVSQKIEDNKWKFSPSTLKILSRKKPTTEKFILSSANIDGLKKVLSRYSKQLEIISTDKASNSIIVKTTNRFIIDSLITLKEIIFIDKVFEAHPEIGIIGYDRSFHGINAVDFMIPGANGKNIVIGVKEQKMDEKDLDLWKRVMSSPIAATTISNHATVISSIIGGAGNSFYDGRGIAWGSSFFPSSFANLFPDDAAILNANKVSVQNHSYGTVVQQFYGAEAVSYDAQTWTNKNLVHIFSAGNKGTSSATEGRYADLSGYANLTGNFKMAKNIITVGALDNNNNIPAESSAGPLYDGRLAPQLIALGPNGTSDAAAVVSGTIGVMQQVFADSNNQALPPASLIKALLYNNADDVYNPGIDYKTGYGSLNSFESIKAIQQKKYDGGTLSQGQSWTKNIIVPANAAQLKITLAWTDTAAPVNNNRALLNDLDMEVSQSGSGFIYKPWVLSVASNIDSLVKMPVRKRDSLNTAEQVSIGLPSPGVYQVKVNGTNLANPNLPFHISYKIDTLNTFLFLSPQHSSDVNRSENPNLFIRWKTFVADTNQVGNLFISYDRGSTWQLIRPSLKIYSNQFLWSIKDTSSTGVFKMETGFGNFFSKEFIISNVIRPVVDFVCADSARLSWKKYIYTNSYRIYCLTDSPYLKPILNISDTFVVLKRSVFPSRVYAVEPLLSNGISATRSIAFDIDLQGVKCFFKTLNYVLLDNNRVNLILDLSITSYSDSVFFEKVTAAGQLLQTYGGAKVINNIFTYNLLVDSVPSGVIYVRGRIKQKNGEIIYTDIIPIQTSGKKIIVFYPNPVNRNSLLLYVLKQGMSYSSQLLIFDMTGRLVKKYLSLPGFIYIPSLTNTSGIYIYELVDPSGVTLQTGKIIIQ